MKKTLFTAALTCAMLIFGTAASLQAQDSAEGNTLSQVETGKYQFSTDSLNILNGTQKKYKISLKADLVNLPKEEGKVFGYSVGGKFEPLSKVINIDPSETQVYLFGYATETDGAFKDFEQRKVSFNVSADPGYYAGYTNEGFYQLDFSSDPFDGVIDIVIGEPLPAPAVTLVVALAAGALFLLYKNRRQRFIQTEQA